MDFLGAIVEFFTERPEVRDTSTDQRSYSQEASPQAPHHSALEPYASYAEFEADLERAGKQDVSGDGDGCGPPTKAEDGSSIPCPEDYYYHCLSVPLDDMISSRETLLDQGWISFDSDGMEALYPPDCTEEEIRPPLNK